VVVLAVVLTPIRQLVVQVEQVVGVLDLRLVLLEQLMKVLLAVRATAQVAVVVVRVLWVVVG
jgi:hypothetical protein